MLGECVPRSHALSCTGCIRRIALGGNPAAGLADIERRPDSSKSQRTRQRRQRAESCRFQRISPRWLAIAPRNGVRVWPHSKDRFFKAMRRAADNAKITWKQNALRHSFISYRLAEIQDVNRVALEAGNSPQMIFRHYRELATPDQARTWFAIAPEAAPNVVPIAVARRKP